MPRSLSVVSPLQPTSVQMVLPLISYSIFLMSIISSLSGCCCNAHTCPAHGTRARPNTPALRCTASAVSCSRRGCIRVTTTWSPVRCNDQVARSAAPELCVTGVPCLFSLPLLSAPDPRHRHRAEEPLHHQPPQPPATAAANERNELFWQQRNHHVPSGTQVVVSLARHPHPVKTTTRMSSPV